MFLLDVCMPADVPVSIQEEGERSEVASGCGKVIRTCHMSGHSSYQVYPQLDTCHCVNFSPEQIWRDREHKGLLLNRINPEVAERERGGD